MDKRLDTPKAIIIAALIVSATIMFTFRYSYSHGTGFGGVRFNHLTGTSTVLVTATVVSGGGS